MRSKARYGKIRSICFTILVAVVISQSLENSAAEISDHWRRLSDLPDKIGVAGAFAGVSGGTLIVAGGANFPDAPPWEGGKKVWYDTIWALENPDGEWREAGRLPRPSGYGVFVSYPACLICLGGGDADRNHADVFTITLQNGKAVMAPMPSLPAPAANSCCAVVNRRIYIAGGIESPTSTAALSTFLVVSPFGEKAKWQELSTWPGPARQLAIAGSCNGFFYLFGGTSLEPGADGKAVRRYLRDAFAYHPDRGWKRIADLPFPLAASPSPAVSVDGKMIIFGGDDAPSADPKTHRGFRDEILEYDPGANTWRIIGRMPAPRATAPVVCWNGGYVIVSGEVRPGVRSREVWMWTP